MIWAHITFFGDSTLLVPTALVTFLAIFLFISDRRTAWQWGMIFCIVGAIVSISKLAFMGWMIGIRSLDFTGFSGHSAFAATVWPVMGWLLCGRFAKLIHRFAVACGYVIAIIVGYSRLVVHAHSVAEVIAGLTLGFIASSIFLVLQRGSSVPRLPYHKIAAILVLPLVLINSGHIAPTQSLLEDIAVLISPANKPFIRSDLHKKIL